MERRAGRFGIRIRMIVTASALVALACLALTLFFVHHEKRMVKEVLTDRGTALATRLAEEVQPLVSFSDTQRMQSIVDRYSKGEDVVYCAIKDARGEILAEGKGDIHPLEPKEILTFTHPISGFETTASAITQPEATALINLSKSRWDRGIVYLNRAALLLSLLIIALGVLVTLLVVQTTLKPLRSLLAAMRRMAGGEIDSPLGVEGYGEIRDLSKALKALAARLQQSTSELKDSSEALEKKVEQPAEELEKRVQELSDARLATLNILEDVREAQNELERANEELRALDEMKSKFIGTISHELKTPFTAIKANIDFILSGREGEIPENLNQCLLTIQRNTNRVQKIMEDFLNVAQIRSGRRRLKPELIQLRREVRACLAEIGPIDDKLRVTIDIPEAIAVFADRNRLHDVYINLLSNALRFSPEGGEIRISARPHDGQILSEVSDQGVGIPEDKRDQIFEEFFQIDRKKYGGTGLGLSIVRGIIQEHGGRIWVESRPGKGSTFFFTLPAGKDVNNGPIGESGEDSDC